MTLRSEKKGGVLGMKSQNLFKWKHYEPKIILHSHEYGPSWINSFGIIDFSLCANRSRKAAKRFFRKALLSPHTQIPRVDKNPAYPPAIQELQGEKRILVQEIGETKKPVSPVFKEN
jgi:hypothetical protein